MEKTNYRLLEDGIEIGGWRITTSSKSNILKAEEIESWGTQLNTRFLPEMVFGTNFFEITKREMFYYIYSL